MRMYQVAFFCPQCQVWHDIPPPFGQIEADSNEQAEVICASRGWRLVGEIDSIRTVNPLTGDVVSHWTAEGGEFEVARLLRSVSDDGTT